MTTRDVIETELDRGKWIVSRLTPANLSYFIGPKVYVGSKQKYGIRLAAVSDKSKPICGWIRQSLMVGITNLSCIGTVTALVAG